MIRFIALEGGPTTGGEITAGRYDIDAEDGLPPGAYRVEIESWQPTGKKEPSIEDASRMVDIKQQVIPPRYNERSELRADVAIGGDKDFKFDLSDQ